MYGGVRSDAAVSHMDDQGGAVMHVLEQTSYSDDVSAQRLSFLCRLVSVSLPPLAATHHEKEEAVNRCRSLPITRAVVFHGADRRVLCRLTNTWLRSQTVVSFWGDQCATSAPPPRSS